MQEFSLFIVGIWSILNKKLHFWYYPLQVDTQKNLHVKMGGSDTRRGFLWPKKDRHFIRIPKNLS